MTAAQPRRVPRSLAAALYLPWALPVWAWLALSTSVGTVVAFLSSFLDRRLPFWWGVQWARGIVLANLSRVDVRGADRLPPGQACVIVCNHQSYFDIPAFWSRWPRPFRFVLKEELRRVPFLGWYCEILGNVFVDRNDRQRAMASLRAARPLLEQGVSILFFAEGTRSRDGRLQPFKKGAFVLALDAGLPVLPVSISGSHRVLPGRSLALLPGRVTVTVHDPVPTAGLGPDDRDRLMEQVRAAIASGLDPFERGEGA